MKRVLFLSYFFPPIGGAGVQRSVKFARYLRDFGWDPVVVTGSGAATGRWTPRDESLASELPADLEIVRVDTPEPPPSAGRDAQLERWLRRRPAFSRWWVDGAIAAGAAVRHVDLVYASMSPYETAEAAAVLARRLGVPWVADLRDPWALDEMLVFPSRLHRELELRRMRRLLASARRVVMNTPEAAARYVRLSRRPAGEVSSVTNGFDASDFAGPAPRRGDDRFRIVHSGYLHTQLGHEHRRRGTLRRVLGGAADVDILTRSHVFLLEAIGRLQEEGAPLVDTVELHLAGLASDDDREAARSTHVVFHGYLPHDESVAMLRTADLLFLPMQNLPEGTRATIVPGKTYEYLAAGRPILAAIPEGDARDFLDRAGGARLTRPDDVGGLAEALRGELERRAAGEPPSVPDPRVVARFDRRHLTEQLAAIFDAVHAGGDG